VLLTRRFVLRDLDGLERVAQRIGELLHPLGVVLPAEHLVDHLDVAEQVGKHAMIGLALHVVEQHRTTAVHVLLQPGDFEVWVDRLVGFDQVTLRAQPVQRAAQIGRMVLLVGGRFFLAQDFLHEVLSSVRRERREPLPCARICESGTAVAAATPVIRVPLHRFLSIMSLERERCQRRRRQLVTCAAAVQN
jgi:hypothetical protein